VECFIFLALEILPTSPSSGQATRKSLLCQPRLLACHSGAALSGMEPMDFPSDARGLEAPCPQRSN